MARDFIKINAQASGATHAPLLRSLVNTMQQANDLVERVKAVMSHNNDGTDFTDVEALFGLSVGRGSSVVTMINNISAAFKGNAQNNDAKQISERVG